jgi:hypothetical protein
MEIFISRDGIILGSWPEPDIRQYYVSGNVVATDFYWYEGMEDWLPLEHLIAQPPWVPEPEPIPVPEIPTNGNGILVLAIAAMLLVGMIALAWGGLWWLSEKRMATRATLNELQDFAQKEREDQKKQITEKGYAEPDPQKTQAELDKLKEMSQAEAGSDKMMTDTVLEIMSTITAKRQVILKAEDPMVALGFGPQKLTSLDEIETRIIALQTCQPPIKDMIDFLQNVDATVRDKLAAKGVAQAGIDSFIKGMHQSNNIDVMVTYWQQERAILDDLLANLNLFKENWGKWHMDGGTVLFDDARITDAYNANQQKIKDDTQAQAEARKKLLSAPTPSGP